VSPLRGEKPQNWPLSKLNTGRFALRAMLPVKTPGCNRNRPIQLISAKQYHRIQHDIIRAPVSVLASTRQSPLCVSRVHIGLNVSTRELTACGDLVAGQQSPPHQPEVNEHYRFSNKLLSHHPRFFCIFGTQDGLCWYNYIVIHWAGTRSIGHGSTYCYPKTTWPIQKWHSTINGSTGRMSHCVRRVTWVMGHSILTHEPCRYIFSIYWSIYQDNGQMGGKSNRFGVYDWVIIFSILLPKLLNIPHVSAFTCGLMNMPEVWSGWCNLCVIVPVKHRPMGHWSCMVALVGQ